MNILKKRPGFLLKKMFSSASCYPSGLAGSCFGITQRGRGIIGKSSYWPQALQSVPENLRAYNHNVVDGNSSVFQFVFCQIFHQSNVVWQSCSSGSRLCYILIIFSRNQGYDSVLRCANKPAESLAVYSYTYDKCNSPCSSSCTALH